MKHVALTLGATALSFFVFVVLPWTILFLGVFGLFVWYCATHPDPPPRRPSTTWPPPQKPVAPVQPPTPSEPWDRWS